MSYRYSDIHTEENSIVFYRTLSINTTSIIAVKLFVTTARLARGQTSVIKVNIGECNGYKIISARVKNVLASINTLHP